jgi:hypothetical protein
VPGAQSRLQFVRSCVRIPASSPVAGACLSTAVSSHCSRLCLCCLILDFPLCRSEAYFDFGEDSCRWIPGVVLELPD